MRSAAKVVRDGHLNGATVFVGVEVVHIVKGIDELPVESAEPAVMLQIREARLGRPHPAAVVIHLDLDRADVRGCVGVIAVTAAAVRL